MLLNVYVPEAAAMKEKLPVMAWIHGGGLQQGAGSVLAAFKTYSQLFVKWPSNNKS